MFVRRECSLEDIAAVMKREDSPVFEEGSKVAKISISERRPMRGRNM